MLCVKFVIIAVCITSASANGGKLERSRKDEEKLMRKIELDLARLFNEAEDLAEGEALVSNYFDKNFDSETKVGDRDTRRTTLVGQYARCLPDLRPVEISLKGYTGQPNHPGVAPPPLCVRVPRCGGCCNSEILTCEPFRTERKFHLVYEVDLLSNSTKNVKIFNVSMLRHKSCLCQCTIKPEDCTDRQVHDPYKCICVCKDPEAERRCNDIDGKHWNDENCSCECDSTLSCSTGEYFDKITCTCELESLAVVPLDRDGPS